MAKFDPQGGIRRETRPAVVRILGLAMAVAVGDAADFAPLSGIVADAETGVALEGVRVVGLSSGRVDWTDSRGRFDLEAAHVADDSTPIRRGVDGGTRLSLRGSGERFDWCSPTGARRLLGHAPASLDPRDLPSGVGWIVSRSGAQERRWSAIRLGGRVAVRETTSPSADERPSPADAPESLSVRLAGRAHRVVPAVADSARSVALPRIRSVAGDFHTHTFLTDGAHSLDDIAAHAFGGTWVRRDANANAIGDSAVSGFGLDWFANSEHGGAYWRDRFGRSFADLPDIVLKGVPIGENMWRWQSLRELSWPAVDSLRGVYEDRRLFQGVEWNVPTHEHASVGILAGDPDPIARFEFFFDEADADTIGAPWPDAALKDRISSHAKALAGARWLREHHPDSSWLVINHPSRLRRTFIDDLRDFHDAGGPVFLGIEAIPGHQKAAWRGLYSYTASPIEGWNARTFGGVDRMLARVGGVMDAMWSEGRTVWVFANSDFHDASGNDHYPGQFSKNLTQVSDKSEAGILTGLRSGATVAVMGDLVDSFSLELDDGARTASMGQKLTVRGDSVDVLVRFHVPARNALGDVPSVDHVDLIRGGLVDRIAAGDPAYSTDSVSGVSVVASGAVGAASLAADGWHEFLWRQPSSRSGFFRIRGSSRAKGVVGWTDSLGNPLCDELQYPNDDAKARSNLWFYSNPVFLERR